MGDLRLTEIWIYPVKSLGGVRCASARVLPKGLQHDRRWMLIDAENNFITQRVYPAMALFHVAPHGEGFAVTHGGDIVVLPLQHAAGSRMQARIWDDQVDVCEVSTAHSQWFSQRLGMDCRLVSFPEENPRPVDPHYARQQEQVSLADAFPFLIIGEQSLADLNSRLNAPVAMKRFRPNFVFAGGAPFEEDSWKDISIGKNKFVVAKPCARCVLTTVDPDTGTKGVEPLATLAAYRKVNQKVLFGQNIIATHHDEIHEGDEIIVG